MDPALAGVAVGVYVGAGASHSWTWSVDTLERLGFSRIALFDESDVCAGTLASLDTLIVGGGDPVAMAEALGPKGAEAIGRFVEGGGRYLGFCAGAYLLMRMDHAPLEPFTFTDATAANVVFELPPIRTMPEKAATAYSDRFTLHPVRERVRFQATGDLEGAASGSPAGVSTTGVSVEPSSVSTYATLFDAPLYGGPPMRLSDGERELLRFDSFRPQTLFLVDEGLACRTLLGASAGFERRHGRGRFFLFAPHLEHPDYPEANTLLGRLVAGGRDDAYVGGHVAPDAGPGALVLLRPPVGAARGFGPLDERFRGALGEARIAALALETSPVSWLIGHKYYDPGKIAVFLETIWRRLPRSRRDRPAPGLYSAEEAQSLLAMAEEATAVIRELRRRSGDADQGRAAAIHVFPLVSRLAATFLRGHFRGAAVLAEGGTESERAAG